MTLRLKIIGTSGYTPWVSKMAKLFTSCRLFFNDKSIQIDIGNKYTGKKVDNLLITHLHYDHVQEFKTLPEDIEVLIPSLTFLEKLQRKNPKVEFRVFKTKIDLNSLKVKAFNVLHSSTTLTYGFKFYWGQKTFVWLPDYCIVPSYSEILEDIDYLFLGASAMKKPIKHKGYGHCQGRIYYMLEKIAKMKKPPKKIYLIHFGMAMRPVALKSRYLQKEYPQLNIDFTFDGMSVKL